MPGKGPRTQAWCFTIFEGHLIESNFQTLKDWEEWARNNTWNGIKYLVFQREKATTTDREHVQGFVRFSQRKRSTQVDEALGIKMGKNIGTAAKGTDNDNRAYCTDTEKSNGEPFEFGECKEPAKNGFGAMVDIIKTGDLDKVIEEHPTEFIRYHKGIEKMISHYKAKKVPKIRDVNVKVYWGFNGGEGKSYAARLFDEDYYELPLSEGGNVWFDGYNGEKTLIIDEADKGAMSFRLMLRVLDIYKSGFQVKGGWVTGAWETVILCANKPPDQWYDATKHQTNLLTRRIHETYQFMGSWPETKVLKDGVWIDYDEFVKKPAVQEKDELDKILEGITW